MKSSIALERVLGIEGGYVNDPNDPGGETKWGISKRSYPNVDIKNLTIDDARAIYIKDFLTPIDAENLPQSVVFQVLDFAVNSGIGTAIRYLQRVVGVADDGYWGPVSQAAISKMSAEEIVLNFNAARLNYMTLLKGWPDFGKGWTRRIAANLQYGAIDLRGEKA